LTPERSYDVWRVEERSPDLTDFDGPAFGDAGPLAFWA
jgi:hypothetical protein